MLGHPVKVASFDPLALREFYDVIRHRTLSVRGERARAVLTQRVEVGLVH